MNGAKRLSLSEIEALPRGSVIWFELHTIDDEETGIDYYDVFPALVGWPGSNGSICWINSHGFGNGVLEINDEMINDNRVFWNSEPERDMIRRGVPEEYYNETLISPQTEQARKLVTMITSNGYTVEEFCCLYNLDEAPFMEVLNGKRELVQNEMKAIIAALHMSDSEARNVFFPVITGGGKIIDFQDEIIRIARSKGKTIDHLYE